MNLGRGVTTRLIRGEGRAMTAHLLSKPEPVPAPRPDISDQ